MSSNHIKNSSDLGNDYALVDSGDGLKLERFGSVTLARPSSVCLWKRRSPQAWKQADATFVPGRDEESGAWNFRGKPFETWEIEYVGCRLVLRLLKNGQVGLFPEHGTYLQQIESCFGARPSQTESPRLLNLFAYTGLASTYFASRGWTVTHVDLSKKALTWAKSNFELNKIPENAIRFICDDALKFLQREVKRGAKYDAVIVDPPSFSRVSKENYWELENIIANVVGQCQAVLSTDWGTLAVTCHDPGIGAEMLANLLRDVANPSQCVIAQELAVPEKDSDRVLPTGSFALLAAKTR